MGKFAFETQGTNTYLVYQIREEAAVDTLSLGMITNNKIPGLLSAFYTQMNASKLIKYNISTKISVQQFFSDTVKKKQLLEVFRSIAASLIAAEEYMIDPDSLILDTEYIYADVSTCTAEMICLPVEDEVTCNTNVVDFFKNIVFSTQFDQDENCDYVAKLITYLNGKQGFALEDFKNLLEQLIREEGAKSVAHVQTKPEQTANTPQPAQTLSQQTVPQQSVPRQPVPQQTMPQQSVPRQPVPQQSVPQQSVPQAMQQQPMQQPELSQQEKKMSAMYLLMHYSKENKEKYNQQKEQSKNEPKKEKEQQNKSKHKKEKKKQGVEMQQGFAVPGAKQPNVFPQPTPQKNTQMTPPVQPQQSAPIAPPVQPQQNIPNNVISDRYADVVPPTANFGETVVLNAGKVGETTVLDDSMQMGNVPTQPYLIRKKNNERINLDKPVFRIGKERSYVDYFVSDNTAISRSHANIISRDGEYFVVDTNSTNHTYVNGAMVQSNTEIKLTHDTKLCLANEEFEFKLY